MIRFSNGTVIDGTSTKPYTGDVVVDNGKIIPSSQWNPNLSDSEDIDISGKIICPGFMDIHSHSDLEVLRNPSMPKKIMQGITFDLSGNCGVGTFPLKNRKEKYADILGHYEKFCWDSFSDFANQIYSGINIGFLQAHAPLRDFVLGENSNRKASAKEVSQMCELLDKSLSEGCFGFSSGLFYAPCLFADRYELIELLKVVKNHNAMFCVHHRCEGSDILSSIDEVLSLAEETSVKLEISHLKAIGLKNQEKVPLVLEKIHNARKRGLDVAFDQYPYNYGSTSLSSLLSPSFADIPMQKVLENPDLFKTLVHEMENPNGWDSITELCGFDNIKISSLEHNSSLKGKSLSECASIMNTDNYTALFRILAEETGYAVMQDVTQTDESLQMIMKDSLMSFGTDSLYTSDYGHPRSFEGALHLINEYVIKKHSLTIEEAVYRMTRAVALRLGLQDMGEIKVGNHADLVVLDIKKANCSLNHVLVNGQFAMKNGKLTSSLSGRVIRS